MRNSSISHTHREREQQDGTTLTIIAKPLNGKDKGANWAPNPQAQPMVLVSKLERIELEMMEH
jgi:hypothetical protein